MANNPAAGWYQDPTSPTEGRYWDGSMWTDSVTRAGRTMTIPIDADRAGLPPVPGSELQPPTPVTAPPPATAAPVVVNTSKSSPAGIIFGVLAAVLVVVLILVLANNSDSDDNQSPATPAPTEAPPATEAPPSSDGG